MAIFCLKGEFLITLGIKVLQMGLDRSLLILNIRAGILKQLEQPVSL